VPGAVNGYLRPDANFGSVHDPLMTGAMVVIGRAQLGTSHDTVVGFLRAAAFAITRVRVRLSDASGVAVEEKSWFNDSTDATDLAEEVAVTSPPARAVGLAWMRRSPFRNSALAPAGSAHKKGTRLLLRTKYDDER
jgi:hypothetical protein